MKPARALLAVAAALLFSVHGNAQSPAFDVASIRMNDSPGLPTSAIHVSSNSLTMRQVSFSAALKWAYAAGNFQISGTQGMQGAPFYDIQARASGGVSESELRLMLRTLLAQRFHLAVRVEKKEMPVWALSIAKDGVRFRESGGNYEPARGPEMPFPFAGYSDDVHMQINFEGGRVRDSFTNISMPLFAGALTTAGGSSNSTPVIDSTGLSGRFDLTLLLDPDVIDQSGEEMLAGLKPALEKQLGLTLERRRAIVESLVVEHADKVPTEN